MDIKIKSIKIDESVYIIYSSMQALYSYYKHSLPKDLRDELFNVIMIYEQAYTKDYLKDFDIKQCILNEIVTFEKK